MIRKQLFQLLCFCSTFIIQNKYFMKQKEQFMDSSKAFIKDEEQNSKQLQYKESEIVPFFSLFRFATKADYIIMTIGTIFALCNGAAMPLFALLWGDMLDSFKTKENMVDQTLNMLLLFIYIGLAVFASGWAMIATWLITGQRQSIQCRKTYLKSLLRQQIGWFDCINQAQLSSQFSTDTAGFQGAISDKVPLVLYVFAMGVSGLIVAFVRGWLLTLVLFGAFPVIIGTMYLYMYHVQNKGKKQIKNYAIAGGKAEQALSAIKTVKMLNGETYQSQGYDECLQKASEGSVKFGIFSGISIGGAFFAMLSSYAIGFWYGAHCINQSDNCPYQIAGQEYTAGIVFAVFFSIIIVGFNLSQLPPALKKITEGRASARRIFKIIDRQPLIKNPVNGVKIQNFKGEIKFNNVSFAYPKQKNRKILDSLSFQINKNKIAFVGESGCGKSTVFQLLMRFYDPDEGVITIDGHDLKTIDLVWWRQVIGYVGQEPVLFATTIKQNLLFAKENATNEELEQALKKAEALEFVNQLEDKMETYVGIGGGQISGGQKQRIAIARAILRDPRILLLDQATSALDRKNEKLIQNTLNKISEARTSITIAHRIKTIMSSDQIFVVEKGRVLQKGSFRELKRFKDFHIQNQEEEEPNQVVKVEKIVSLDKQIENNQLKKITKQELRQQERQELMEVYNKNTYRRVIEYAKGNQLLFVLGIFVSGVLGAVYPVFSIFISSMLQIMLTKKNFQDQADTKALIFFLLGILGLFMSIIQNSVFSYIGEKITKKIRSQTFYKLLKLPVSWHEKPKNSVGSLTANLAVDCKQVKQMTTTYIYGLTQNLVCLIAGIVISFIYEWRTSLVSIGLIPFLIAAGAIRMAFRTGSATKSEEAYKSSANIIMESMTNIRTVCSFGYENIIDHKYSAMMQQPYKLAVKNGIVSGFFYGIAQLIMFIVIALIFYLGSIFVFNYDVHVDNMFTAVFAIFFSGMTVGNNSHILPDMAQCKISAANLFLILDTKDEEQIQLEEKSKMIKAQIKGGIQLKNIKFKYESRNQYLFNDFSLDIPYGEKVAFVGTSGCGKSTILSFLLRFYEPESGQITLNDVNIKDYDIHYLRSQFGVVSQQPVLFNASFKQNIQYNLKSATDEQIIEAAKQAHSYHFIMSKDKKVNQGGQNKNLKQSKLDEKVLDKEGFDRSVGIKGSHISGGQKQRVAIARAILRKPQILLLDEATSALDSKNEKKVQDCLDEIMANKSCISIAHRLDTIKNSKLIYVFDKGRVAQIGNFQQLMNKKGYFYNLQKGIQFK